MRACLQVFLFSCLFCSVYGALDPDLVKTLSQLRASLDYVRNNRLAHKLKEKRDFVSQNTFLQPKKLLDSDDSILKSLYAKQKLLRYVKKNQKKKQVWNSLNFLDKILEQPVKKDIITENSTSSLCPTNKTDDFNISSILPTSFNVTNPSLSKTLNGSDVNQSTECDDNQLTTCPCSQTNATTKNVLSVEYLLSEGENNTAASNFSGGGNITYDFLSEDEYDESTESEGAGPVVPLCNITQAAKEQAKLDALTAKIFRGPISYEIQQSWIHPFCLRYSSIGPEIKKTWQKCQMVGIDWTCVYSELGGGDDGFSLVTLRNLFSRVHEKDLQRRLLQGVENCNTYWQNYKKEEMKRVLAHELEVELDTKIGRKGRDVDLERIKELRLQKLQETQKLKEMKQQQDTENAERMKDLQAKHACGMITPQEKCELDELTAMSTTPPPVYSKLGTFVDEEDRIDLSLRDQLSACITQEVVRACEPKVMDEIKKLT